MKALLKMETTISQILSNLIEHYSPRLEKRPPNHPGCPLHLPLLKYISKSLTQLFFIRKKIQRDNRPRLYQMASLNNVNGEEGEICRDHCHLIATDPNY